MKYVCKARSRYLPTLEYRVLYYTLLYSQTRAIDWAQSYNAAGALEDIDIHIGGFRYYRLLASDTSCRRYVGAIGPATIERRTSAFNITGNVQPGIGELDSFVCFGAACRWLQSFV